MWWVNNEKVNGEKKKKKAKENSFRDFWSFIIL